MTDLSKEHKEKLSRIQLLEQNIQGLLTQKQQFQVQLFELENALKELEKTEEAYKIVGNLMIKTNREDLQKDLKSKRELSELRVNSIEKQEKQLSEKIKELQEDVLKGMKKE